MIELNEEDIMPRKRDDIIRESLEELQALELQYRGKAEGPRVAMLLNLKQNPELQIEEVALHVGFSLSAVKRWLRAYRIGGMNALLQKKIGGRAEGAIDPGLNRLKKMLVAGDFSRLVEVEHWLEEYRHSHRPRRLGQPSTNGIPKRNEPVEGGGESVPHSSEEERQEIGVEYIARFFNRLSDTPDPGIWGNSLKAALKEIFPAIDYLTLVVNLQCDIFNPDTYEPVVAVVQHVRDGEMMVNTISADPAKGNEEAIARLMNSLKGSDFPFKDYRSPRHFVFFLSRAYLGVITLWQKRTNPPIPKQTLAGIEKLRPTLIYLFSDIVARCQAARPMELVVEMITSTMRDMFDLTAQETRILNLQLIGMSYDEIGSALNITVNTVRSHVKSTYTKAGAHSLADFYAKYFSLLMKDVDRS